MIRRAGLVVMAALVAAGCGQADQGDGEAVVTVYVSAPKDGPAELAGRGVVQGARLALAGAGHHAGGVRVEGYYMDASQPPGHGLVVQPVPKVRRFDSVAAAANARMAVEDSTSIAYIGELDSGASRTSVPITNQAGLLQVAPGSGASDLVRAETFNDDVPEEVQTSGRRTFAQLGLTYKPGETPRAPPTPSAGFAERVEREYAGHVSGPWAAYGYEAMASVLAAIDRASDPTDRSSVIDAYFDGTERDSVLGTYSITDTGEFEPLG